VTRLGLVIDRNHLLQILTAVERPVAALSFRHLRLKCVSTCLVLVFILILDLLRNLVHILLLPSIRLTSRLGASDAAKLHQLLLGGYQAAIKATIVVLLKFGV